MSEKEVISKNGMTPRQAYHHAIAEQGFTPDPVQAEAVQLTQQLYLKLIERSAADRLSKAAPETLSLRGLWHHLSNPIRQALFPGQVESAIPGLYFWGGVGGGKTWLIDSFFNTLPFAEKRRIHFHHFMLEIPEQLKILPNTPDPLHIIAGQMAQQFRLICIDEFHVQDITDAMLLAGILKALFFYRVTLVMTSNSAPDELYKNGLQREQFLPAIEWIKQNTQVFELHNKTDYRHQVLTQSGRYLKPLNEYNANMMLQHFIELSDHAPVCPQSININKRPIPVIALSASSDKHSQSVVWFEFDTLCNTARSNSDYLFIADQYDNILITDLYQMDEEKDDVAKRFMHLIDALYDRHCYLVISAETGPDDLYIGRRLELSFQRTASRLKEMRSKLYLCQSNPGACPD